MAIKQSVIIPWRTDHGPREEIFQWIIQRWNLLYSDGDVELIHGDAGGDVFSRSATRNYLADLANSDVLIFADADTIPFTQSIDEAVYAVNKGHWAIAYAEKKYYNLSEWYTKEVLKMPPNSYIPEPVGHQYEHKLLSWAGMIVISKEDFNKVRYSTGFVGWSHEDVAFHIEACAKLGQPFRSKGWVGHCWHPRKDCDFGSPEELENRKLFQRDYVNKYGWIDPRTV